MVTHNQILFIHGLAPFQNRNQLRKAIKRVGERLKNNTNHATIEIAKHFTHPVQELALSYQAMNQLHYKQVPFHQGIGNIAAESFIPYPPGIPLIIKGEKITTAHFEMVQHLRKQGVRTQQREKGIRIYVNKGEEST